MAPFLIMNTRVSECIRKLSHFTKMALSELLANTATNAEPHFCHCCLACCIYIRVTLFSTLDEVITNRLHDCSHAVTVFHSPLKIDSKAVLQ